MGDGDLYKIAIEGGAPIRVSDIPEFWTDSSWAENGTILLSGAGGIWEVDDTGGSLRPLISLPENEGASAPVMLPGGGAVLFQHIHAGGESVAIGDWSPDGRWLVIDIDAGPHFDLWILGIEDESDTRPLLDSRFDEQMARISPDGRYFAYVSNESGREEVYLQRFPELGDKRQISNAGGTQPIWSRDGRRILYRSDTHVMAVEVSSAPPLDVSAPEPLVEDTFMNEAGAHTFYDVMPDGKLIMLEADGARQGTHVNVVVNWFQELEARVPR